MKKIINDPNLVVEEMIEGYVAFMNGLVEKTGNPRVLKARGVPHTGKVGIVTGGGSGHKPAFCGYVGRNMVDAVAIGEIFSSPPAKMFYDAFKAADGGAGVACLYGNYAGDNMNVKIAMDMAEDEGITVKTVVANDDVPSAKKGSESLRRGVAGEIIMWKVGAAMANMGASLDEVIEKAQEAMDNTRSVGVGLSSCIIPAVGHPNFHIEEGKMEMGIGHHGEPGIAVMDLQTSNQIANNMIGILLEDMPIEKGGEVAVIVSGLGGTPLMEQYIFFNDVQKRLLEEEIRIYKSYVGNYFTSLDMAGITLTITRLNDQLKKCLDYEAECMALKEFKK